MRASSRITLHLSCNFKAFEDLQLSSDAPRVIHLLVYDPRSLTPVYDHLAGTLIFTFLGSTVTDPDLG
jgi:hypothetical protein